MAKKFLEQGLKQSFYKFSTKWDDRWGFSFTPIVQCGNRDIREKTRAEVPYISQALSRAHGCHCNYGLQRSVSRPQKGKEINLWLSKDRGAPEDILVEVSGITNSSSHADSRHSEGQGQHLERQLSIFTFQVYIRNPLAGSGFNYTDLCTSKIVFLR